MGAHIPQRVMKMNNKAQKVGSHLPRPEDAVEQYRLNGGHITDPEQNILDPLRDNPIRISLNHLLENIHHSNQSFMM